MNAIRITSGTVVLKPAGYRPVRESIFVGLLVMTSFVACAGLFVLVAIRHQNTELHQALDTLAWQAVGYIDPVEATENVSTNPARHNKALDTLKEIAANGPRIDRIFTLKAPVEQNAVVLDTGWLLSSPPEGSRSDVIGPELLARARQVVATDKSWVGSLGSYKMPTFADQLFAIAPIIPDGEHTLGVAVVVKRPGIISFTAPLNRAAIFCLIGGGVLSVLLGLIVWMLRNKSMLQAAQLAEAEHIERIQTESLGEIFYTYDPARDFLKLRGDTQRILGYEPVELEGGVQSWLARVHPDDYPRLLGEFRRVRAASLDEVVRFSMDFRVRAKNGRYVWLLIRGQRTTTSKGILDVGGMFNINEMRELEERLRSVMDASGIYIWEVNDDGFYTYVSEKVHDVLGYRVDEVVGKTYFDFIPEEDRPDMEARTTLLRMEHPPIRDFVSRKLKADGTLIWISTYGTPIFDADGDFVAYRGATKDITEKKNAEEALIREKEAAQAADRAKNEFLGVMSHEIRTPLNSIIGFADLLAQSKLEPEQMGDLELIRRSGDALLHLLNDILDFTRIEAGKMPLEFSAVPLRGLLEEVIDIYRPMARAKDIRISLKVANEVPQCVRTDAGRLRQILLNLVGNAMKFTERGEVRLMAGGEDKGRRFSLTVEVRDTGIGIPREKTEALFKPFSQVDTSISRRHEGTGLGLAICRRLANLLGGEVGLKETSPLGSVFYLILDLECVEITGQQLAAAPDLALPDPSLRVLVAEDNRSNRHLAVRILSQFGLSADEASNGRQCVEMHTRIPYDLILMDVQMPETDGIEATRLIRQAEERNAEKRACIIAFTANALAGDRDICLAAGMDDYVNKPIRSDDLRDALRRCGI